MQMLLRTSALLAVAQLFAAPADAQCAEVSSFGKVRDATFVGEVRVRSKREWTELDRGQVRSCGFFYEAEILDIWKGDPPARVEFYSEKTLPFDSDETHLTILTLDEPRPRLTDEMLADLEITASGEAIFPCLVATTTIAREVTAVPAGRAFVADDRLPFWIYHRADANAERIPVETIRTIVVEEVAKKP
jgi:hypothetical protein